MIEKIKSKEHGELGEKQILVLCITDDFVLYCHRGRHMQICRVPIAPPLGENANVFERAVLRYIIEEVNQSKYAIETSMHSANTPIISPLPFH